MSLFTKALHQATTNVLMEINLKCNLIAWDLFTSVVRLSPSPSNNAPYALGILANQWYPTVRSPSSSKGTDRSPTGAGSLNRINNLTNGSIEFFGKDGKMILTNNMDYAYNAEVIGWPKPRWKGAKPYAMVARSLQATAAKYKRVVIK